MLNAGVPYWVAFAATIALAFAGGFLIERIVIRPIEGKRRCSRSSSCASVSW